MAYSYAQYPGNGSNRTFSVEFPYLDPSHVKAYVNGTPATFSWLTGSTIQLTNTPNNGDVVEIRRETSHDTRLVDFQNGSILDEPSLDLATTQDFYLAQEAFDSAARTIQLAYTGVFDALNKRVTNVATPTSGKDAVNKDYTDNLLEDATAASTSAAAAKVSETNAKTSETNAKSSETNAKASETNAKASEVAAAASASQAANSASAASLSETSASQSAQTALDSASRASVSEANAKTSETNAKASENVSLTKAQEAAGSATASANSAAASKASQDAATVSASMAASAANDARNWANEAVIYNIPVYDPTHVYSFPERCFDTDGQVYTCTGTNISGLKPSLNPSSWSKLTLISSSIFEADENGALMPKAPGSGAGSYDPNFEYDANGAIMPRA